MAKKNAIDNKSGELTIDPGASGDSFIQLNIGGTGEFRIGVDDDASDSFKLSQESALGTNDTFVMTSSGERTMPLNPVFLAYNSVTDDDVTGDGTTVDPIEFDTEVFDIGSNYNAATDTFSAPIAGRYLFFVSLFLEGFDGTQTGLRCNMETSAGVFTIRVFDPVNADVSGDLSFNGSIIVNLTASQTVTVSLRISGGNKTVDIHGGADRLTVFGGCLLV